MIEKLLSIRASIENETTDPAALAAELALAQAAMLTRGTALLHPSDTLDDAVALALVDGEKTENLAKIDTLLALAAHFNKQ